MNEIELGAHDVASNAASRDDVTTRRLTLPQAKRDLYVVGSIAIAALIVAAWSALREEAPPAAAEVAAPASACVDVEARAEIERLRRALELREIESPLPAVGAPGSSLPLPASAEPRRRQVVKIEVPNPAVTVRLKDDGLYEIRNTDPKLTGAMIEATAIMRDGRKEKLLIRVPAPG